MTKAHTKINFIATVCLAITALLSVCILSSCTTNTPNDLSLTYVDVSLDYGNINYTQLERPTDLNSMQDFSDFIDYCVFYPSEQPQYTTITDNYLEILQQNADYQYRWAGQYASLGHNFATGYDDSRLSSNQIGITTANIPFAFKKYQLSEDNVKVYTYEYFSQTLLNKHNRNYSLRDFDLYKHNKGFVKCDNSEQLWYAAMQGYMPVPANSNLQKILSKALGILNAILTPDMTEYQKVNAIYNYIICENTYDYSSLHFKDSPHTDYEAYFLEGIFNSQNAVCDGIVKAMVLLCRLEGIEAYHIGAVGHAGGHAYIYIKVDNTYYLSCPTLASFVQSIDNKRYHMHTYSYMLTDYYTSSSDWDFFSGQLPDIGEQIKKTPKYNYWENQSIQIDDKTYSLSPNNSSELCNMLEGIAKASQQYDIPIQIEVKCSYDIANTAYNTLKTKYNITKVNNGMFNGEKLYSFLIY